MVEAGVSLARARWFLLCGVHKTIKRGELDDIGTRMTNLSCAYEGKKPQHEIQNTKTLAKELLEKNWELSLLKSQLEEAMAKIKLRETPKGKSD